MLDPGVSWLANGYRIRITQPPEDDDSLPLNSEDDLELSDGDVLDNYANSKVPTLSELDLPRAQSCQPTFSHRGKEKFNVPQRPTSARPPTGRLAFLQRRVRSAGTARSRKVPSAESIRKMYWAQDPRSKLAIDFHPDPAIRFSYLDRHARCFDHTHIHQPLLSYRPHPACGGASQPCNPADMRPGSSGSDRCGFSSKGKHHRPGNSHRPQTAPGTRKEFQVLTKSNFLVRGLKPHFCNFVQPMQLHGRGALLDSSGGLYDSDYDFGCNLVTESTGRRRIGQWRRDSRGSASGTEGRPASPSSDIEEGLLDEAEGQWSRTRVGVTIHGAKKSGTGEGEKDDRPFIQIPSPVPPSDPKPAWNDKGSKKSSGRSSLADSKSAKSSKSAAKSSSKGSGDDDSSAGRRKRSCMTKKQKKSSDRKRQNKEEMELKTEETLPSEEQQTEKTEDKSDSTAVKVDATIPDLPSFGNKNRDQKGQNKPDRHMINPPNDFLKADINEILDQEMKLRRRDFEVDTMADENQHKPRPRMQSWLTGRLALSQQSCRFTLPMDMRLLETMTPQEYLKTHCVISTRRQSLYQKIFLKSKDKSGIILIKDLEKALKDVLVNTITKEQVQDLCQLLEVNEDTKMDYQLFCGISAFAERILYPKFVTEDTAELPEFQREKIECADFCALDWKFHGVNVNPPVKKMLKSLG